MLSLLTALGPAMAQDDPGPGAVVLVESGGDTRVTEGGPGDSYTAVLGDAPTGDVVVALSADAQLAVEPISLTFTLLDWSVPEPVSVTAVDDDVAGGDRTVAIGHAVSSTDLRYDGLVVSDVLVALADDDKAGVSVDPTALALTEGGASGAYRLRLASRPTATVSLETAIDVDGVTADPATVVFPPEGWNAWQTVSVAVTNDDVAGGVRDGTIRHTVESEDSAYEGLAIEDVTVSVTDDDHVGVTVAPTTVQVAEGGATATYQVHLGSEPAATVAVTISTDDETTVSPTSLSFSPSTWSVPRVVTVTAVDDGVQEGVHQGIISHRVESVDPAYDAFAMPTVTASITDGRRPGVTISESSGSTRVTEGGATDSYTVVLADAPTQSVIIGVAPDGQVTAQPSAITFNTANWDTAVTVVVRAVDDDVAEGLHSGAIRHTVASQDAGYNGLTVASVSAAIADDDTAAVQVSPLTIVTSEGGAAGGYDVVLGSRPTNDVTIRVAPDAQTVTTPTTLVFTPPTWGTSRHVTVTATEDGVDEGDHQGTIRHNAESDDTNYSGIAVPTVTAEIADRRTPGVLIFESWLQTRVTEGGQGDSYTIALLDDPKSTVVVELVADGQVTVSPAEVTFTPQNWRDAQTISVAAVDDARIEGDHDGVIRHLCESDDDAYDGIDVRSVNVSISDNDQAGVTVSPDLLELVEGDEGATYAVALASQPESDVTVRVVTDGYTTAEPASLRFTPENWQNTQSVRLRAPDDAAEQGTRTSRVSHQVESADDLYDGLTPDDVTVTVHDDERASVVVSTSATEITEPGGDARLILRLTSRPSHDVVVPVSSSSAMCSVAPDSARLTRDTWETGVQVIVSTEMDPDWTGVETCQIAIGPTSCDDDDYDGLDPEDMVITVRVAPAITLLRLPSMLRAWPPLPGTPSLHAIDNPDGLNDYVLAWEPGARAESYVLQRAVDAGFAAAQEIYTGPDLSYTVSGQGAGRYYYRVGATNAWGVSAWSGAARVDVLWEAEPNDDAPSQANGPLVPGLWYHGALADAGDLQDYYLLDKVSDGGIEVSLGEIPSGQNYDLVVRNASLDLVGYSAELGSAEEHVVTVALPPGTYYVQVYRREGGGDPRYYLLSYTLP